MQELREKVALTALLAALLAILIWLGVMFSSVRDNEPVRFSDALWTMTRSLREGER